MYVLAVPRRDAEAKVWQAAELTGRRGTHPTGLSGRVKSGHTWTGQNRPTGDRVETVRFYPAAS